MTYKSITLKRGKEQSLRRFHPWVFSGALDHVDPSIQEGDVVSVYTHDHQLVGNGHYQLGSIAVRMLSFDSTAIDEHFFAQRLLAAYRLRMQLGLLRADNNALRLVHGEGDFLPGLVVDLYGHTAVMQAHSPGMHHCRQTIAQALTQLPNEVVRNVYYKSDTTLPYQAHLDSVNEYIVGGYETDIAIENGLQFHVDWLRGQKTGFFVDQRENRYLLQRYSHQRRVLNMFCYTGGFSVYALRGGATLVHSVDSSAKAVKLTNDNVALNFPPEDLRHEAFDADGFKFLDDMPTGTYDLIVLDPPAFAKHRSAVRNALVGYRRINTRAFEKIAAGGILFTFFMLTSYQPRTISPSSVQRS